MSTRETGLLLASIGVAAALVQGGIVRQLSGKVEDANILRNGVFLQVIAFALTALAPDIGRWMLYASGHPPRHRQRLSQPSVSAYVSEARLATGARRDAGGQPSMGSLARMFGPAMGGFLYGHVGARSPYWAAAMGMALALLLALTLPTKSPETPPAPAEA